MMIWYAIKLAAGWYTVRARMMERPKWTREANLQRDRHQTNKLTLLISSPGTHIHTQKMEQNKKKIWKVWVSFAEIENLDVCVCAQLGSSQQFVVTIPFHWSQKKNRDSKNTQSVTR